MSDEVDNQLPLFPPLDGPEPTTQQLAAHRDSFKAALAAARDANKAKILDLRSLGRKIDPGNVALVQLDSLLALILDEDARLHFDVEFETRMGEVLDQALSVSRRNSLLGGNGETDKAPPQLFRQN